MRLDMHLDIVKICNQNISRVASLIQKTNQFNLTNLRMNSQQIMNFSLQNDSYAVCSILRDRFGSSGIIGVLLGEEKYSNAMIQEWVLSCRIFGRGVEHAMFSHFIKWVKCRELKLIETNYFVTERNKLVGETLDILGFSEGSNVGDKVQYTLTSPNIPTHFIKTTG